MALAGLAAHPLVRFKEHFIPAGGGGARAKNVGLAQQRMRMILPRHTKETRSPSPKADVHRIMLLLMPRFYGVVVLIWETTIVYAKRCDVCIAVGSSLSLCPIKSCGV